MLQSMLVLAAIGLALGYLAVRFYRTARAVKRQEEGCGSGCGCGDSATVAVDPKHSKAYTASGRDLSSASKRT